LGEAGLTDRSSRPAKTRTNLDEALRQRIEQLRRARMPMRRIAAVVGRSVATISRVLAGLGLSSLKALDPAQPVVRYEREAPGELLHMDTKKLGRIVRPSHRVTGDRRDSVDGAGWEFAHVAIDDHSRAGFVQMHCDERKESAVEFLKACVAHYAALGVQIKRLITDNGSAYRSVLFNRTCQALGIKHSFTNPTGHRPTERPNASSRLACANGPTAGPMPTALSARPGCLRSLPTTTPAGPIQPWATSLRLPDSAGITYCNSTANARFVASGIAACSADSQDAFPNGL